MIIYISALSTGHVALDESKAWVVGVSDSPKPPPCRVTLTFPAINRASCCVFAMAGQGKADMVKVGQIPGCMLYIYLIHFSSLNLRIMKH